MPTLTVTNTSDNNAGSLRSQIAAAASGDTLVFDAALTGQTITLLSGELLINKSLTITGLGAGNLTISGNNAGRVFHVENAGSTTPETVIISGLTITGGASNNGAGLFSTGETLTVDGLAITANVSPSVGGGLFWSGNSGVGSTLTVRNSSVWSNTAPGAGAGVITVFGTALIQNTTVSDNAGDGVNVNNTSTLGILNSTIVGNTGTNLANNSVISSAINNIIQNWGGAAPVAESYNLFQNTPGFATAGTDVIGAPNLAAATTVNGLRVFLLNASSPAINAGDPAYTALTAPLTDQIGQTRFFDNRIDLGAVERQVVAVVAGPASTASPPQTPAPPPTVGPTVNANFSGVLGKLGFGVNAPPTTVTTPTGQVLPNPLLEQQKAVAALIAKVDAGQMTLKAAQDIIVDMADATTSVASMSYQFFTGKLPTRDGLAYLVSSPENPADLNDGYYAGMSVENRYINFAVNLAKPPGPGVAFFQSGYGSLSLADATAKAYAEIFGAPSAGKVAAILTPERTAYFNALGGDALGAKAAMVGWLLGEAAKSDTGPYAARNENFLYDLLDGTAAFGADAHLYDNAGPIAVGLIGAAEG